MKPTSPTPPGPHMTGQDEHLYDDEFVHNEDVAHEHTDVNVRQLLIYTAGLVLTCVVSAIIVWGLFIWFERLAAKNDPPVSPLASTATQLPGAAAVSDGTRQGPDIETLLEKRGVSGPRLLTTEPTALRKLREMETGTLEQYGWIDQKTGVARLPIAEAKKKLLQSGVPVRGEALQDPSLGTRAASRGESSSGRAIPTQKTQNSEQRTQNPETGQEKKPEQAAKPAGPGKH